MGKEACGLGVFMRPVTVYFFFFFFFDCVFLRGYQRNAYRVQEVMYMREAFGVRL